MALRQNKKRLFSGIRNGPEKYIQAVFFLLLVLVAFVHLRSTFLAQLAMNRGANMTNFSSTLADPDALAYLARKEHLNNGNLPEAFRLYRRGLSSFALHVPSLLGMVELYSDMGEQDRAVQTLGYVNKISSGNTDTAWTRALLAYDLDSEDVLASNLVWLSENAPARLGEIFDLANLRWQEPAGVMRRFKPSLYPDLLSYYIRLNEPDKAETVWQEINRTNSMPLESVLEYVNFLLRRDRVLEAGRIWRSAYHSGSSLLYNPALREPFVGSAFAWQITRREGVSWQQLADKGGLRIQFDGTANPSFSLAQTVPLKPGRYVLTGFFRTDGLTTDQLPYWSVTGYKCEGLRVKEDMLPPTSAREKFTLAFTVPDACAAVRLALQRNTSYFFDNKIKGSLVLDSLELAPAEPGPHPVPVRLKTLPGEQDPQPVAPTKKTSLQINKLLVQ
jgi:hypothetical protein